MQGKVLAVIVAAGAMVRFAHWDFGLPFDYHPDEVRASKQVATLVGGRFRLGGYQHGPLLRNLAAVGIAAAGLVVSAPAEGPALAERAQIALRWVSLIAGTLAILASYLLARRFLDPPWALGAAALYAVLPVTVLSSTYGAPDTLLSLLFLLGWWLQLRLAETPSPRLYFLAAIVVVLALATKLNGGFLALSLVAAHALAEGRSRWLDRRAVLPALAGAAVGLMIGFPQAPFEWSVVVDTVKFEIDHLFVWGQGVRIGGAEYFYVFHFLKSLPPTTGAPLLATMIAGLASMLWRRERRDLVLLAGVVPYYLVIEHVYKIPVNTERYVLPLIGPYAVSALITCSALLARIPRLQARPAVAAASAAFVLGAWPGWLTLNDLRALVPDTRDTMRAYVAAHLTPRTRVLLPERPWQFYPSLEGLPVVAIGSRFGEDPRAALVEADYAIASDFNYQRYLERPDDAPEWTAFYRELLERAEPVFEAQPAYRSYLFNNPTLRLLRLRRDGE